eukprot:TRINITY_DN4277_c0_g2_i5.p1 TRINITY_DN4277_c0_g2~~TRINITY_DN4277_c0_g2_i5.p1  ORF type:complete len:621 (-),score=46.63 TRINITY_DN4277_c0_g2_i5:78-1865(-)
MAKIVAVTAASLSRVAFANLPPLYDEPLNVSDKSDLYACVVPSTDFVPHLSSVRHTVQTSYQACQISCALTDGCYFFAYNKHLMQCNYAGATAEPVPDYRYVSGRRVCQHGEEDEVPVEKCRTDYPNQLFPGRNAFWSNVAWPFGKQPKSLECWPKNADGSPSRCRLRLVLEDTRNGWPGVCGGMEMQNRVSTESCRGRCVLDPQCSSYQTESGQCNFGVGHDCYFNNETPPDWRPSRAQRYQHGSVRVLMDLQGLEVLQGLSEVFKPLGDGYFRDHAEAADHCKLACYSQIECQYWSYSTELGCWIEDVEKDRVNYPLTLPDVNATDTAIAGEYIQHVCEEPINASWQLADVHNCALSGYRPEYTLEGTESAPIKQTAVDCQQLCFSTPGCAQFSFQPITGSCQRHPVGAVNIEVAPGYVSGPPSCLVTTPGWQGTRAIGSHISGYVPFCALTGYRIDPLVTRAESTVKGNALLCQTHCYNTMRCSHFSFQPATGRCYLHDGPANMLMDPDYVSGPQECRDVAPGPQAYCKLHERCAAAGFHGVCCPTQDAIVMECCDTESGPASTTAAAAAAAAAPAQAFRSSSFRRNHLQSK